MGQTFGVVPANMSLPRSALALSHCAQLVHACTPSGRTWMVTSSRLADRTTECVDDNHSTARADEDEDDIMSRCIVSCCIIGGIRMGTKDIEYSKMYCATYAKFTLLHHMHDRAAAAASPAWSQRVTSSMSLPH